MPFAQYPCQGDFMLSGSAGESTTIRAVNGLKSLTPTELEPGEPMEGFAPPSGYVYFKLPPPDTASDIYFDVTPLNGDPDVFVTCLSDANLSGDDNGTPSLQNHKWGSLSIGIDTIMIPANDLNYCSDAFVAGVSSFGTWPSNFSIVATTAEHYMITLNDGYPQDGSVLLQHYAYFQFTVPSTTTSSVINLALTTVSGDADMYITLDGREPSRTVWDYHGVGTGATELVSIRGDGAGCPLPDRSTCTCPATGACNVKIAVYGFRQSVFNIMASLDNAELRLQDNVPTLVNVNASEYAYFRYDVPLTQLQGKSLTIAVNPINGDPDLYVSHLYTNPTAVTKAQHPADVFTSAKFGDDEVTLTPADGLVPGTWHIGVQAFGVISTFSVVATLTTDSDQSITGLLPNTPSTGSVQEGKFKMYGFTAQFGSQDNVQDVRFSVTPLDSGEITVYVRKCPNNLESGCQEYLPSTTTYDFTSQHTANSEVVMIHHDDAKACVDCVYVVGVYGTDEGLFSITASTGLLHTMLRQGVPMQDVIAAKSYHYYTFLVNSNEDVAISVTPFNGDVDLVVSACGYVNGEYNGDVCNTNPNMSSYDWASFGFGNDTIFIPTSDKKRCQPVFGGAPCIYNIGVYGFQPSSFSIVGSMHSDDNTVLLPGTPQSGAVGQDVLDNFEFFVRPHITQVTFTLTTTAGDADLYVLVNTTRGRAGPARIGIFDYAEQNIYGDDTLTIDMDSAKVQQHCPNFLVSGCVFGLGVWGAADYPSTFSIIGTVVGGSGNNVQQLSEGISVTSTVQPGAYQYFSFAVSEPETVIISVTPTGTGDPNIYVSNSLTYLPSKSNYTYASTRQGFDVLTIDKYPANPKACPKQDGDSCTLAIAVAVAEGSLGSTFNILVRTSDGEPTLLQPGVRMRSSVAANQQDQYIMSLVDESYEHLEVSLQSLVGDADLYVTLDGAEPGPNHWQFASLSQSARDYVVIHKSDSAWRTYCSHKVVCPVRVAVRGFRDTTYDIVASTNDSPVQLTAGQTTYDHVSAGLYDYFMFTTHLQSGNLRFVLQGLSGDPDMAVGRGDLGQFRPNLKNASSYIRTSTYSDLDVIEIDHNDHDACKGPCTYYIGVTGDRSNSSFGISVSEVNSSEVVTLLDGQSVLGYVSPHTTAQALWVVQRSAKNMTVTVNPLSGDPDLYINIGANAEAPNAMSHDYASISMNGQDEVRMQWSDHAFTEHCAGLPSCVVRIGVQGFKTSWFYLTATSSLITTLQENVPQTGSVQPAEYTYFAFTVSNTGAAAFSLTSISGDPDMYIGTDPLNLPTAGNFNFSETAIGGGSIEIYPGDDHACEAPCTYFIGVTGFYEAASFSILARTRSTAPVRLSDGRPQIDSAKSGQRNYYIIDVPANDPSTEFEISLTPRFGDADLYARLDDGPLDREHFQYFSMYSGADRISITGNDGPYNASCKGTTSCTAHIMVYGFSECEYTIVGTSQGNLHRLDDGTPFAEDSQPGHPEFFVFRVDNNADISFALSVTAGDADMYVTSSADNTTRPSASEYTWKSAGLGYESIFIDQNDGRAVACTKPCFYYVGVYAFGGNTATYSLTASTGIPSLPPGRPVAGLVDRSKFSYFLFQAAPGIQQFSVTIAATRGVAVGYIGNELSARTGALIKPTLKCRPQSVACSSYIVEHAAWATAGSSGNTMTVRSTDPQWRDGGQYIVAVLAPPTASSFEAAFTVTATSSDTTTELADGIPSFGSVDAGQYQYYYVTVADKKEDVLLQATAFSGDNDLYVSVHPNNTAPSQENGFDFFAVSFGNDSVYLTATQLKVCHDKAAEMGLSACRVYVGVYGFTAAQYSILAKVSGREEVLLTDGVPQSGFVAAGGYSYYRAVVDFPADNQLAYSVVVTPRSGDPDLFIISTRNQLPSASNYDRRSIGFGRESIIFTPSDAAYNASGVLHIAVFGWSTDSTFDVVFATQSNEQTLSDGRSSQVNILPRSSMFLRFPFPAANKQSDLQYAIAPLSGSIDFFITRPENSTSSSRPGPDNYIWKGHASAGGAAGTIMHDDPNFLAGVDYVFGLYNNDGSIASTVSMVAHLSTTLVSLTDGASQLGGVAAGDYQYFTYSCGASCNWQDLVVSATPVGSGNVRVVVTDLYVPGTGEGGLPTLANNVWSSDSGTSTDPNTVTIKASDPKHTAGKTIFTIGVYGKGVASAFNVLAASSEEPTLLRMGQPSARVSVERGDTKHFFTYLESTADDLVITVTPLSGDADLLVSATNPNPYCVLPFDSANTGAPRYARKLMVGQQELLPAGGMQGGDSFGVGAKLRTCYGARWLTAGDNANSAPDVLTIQAANPCGSEGTNTTGCLPKVDWRPGFYYIGVFAQTTTTFSVTSYFNSIASLNNGEAATGSSSALTPVYFTFEDGGDADGAARDIKLVITRTLEANKHPQPLIVYANSCHASECTQAQRRPSAGNFAPNAAFQVAKDKASFFITPLDEVYCTPKEGDDCNYYFGVFANCPGSVNPLDCSQKFQLAVTLQDGNSVEVIGYSSIAERMAVVSSVAPSGTAPLFETYLSGTGSTDLNVRLSTCANAYSAVYVCDPSPESPKQCADAFSPGPDDHTYSAVTSFDNGGRGYVNVSGITASSVYLSVQETQGAPPVMVALPALDASGHSSVKQAAAGSFSFELDLYSNNAQVVTVTDGAVSASVSGATVDLHWTPAVLVRHGKHTPMVNAEYRAFAAPAGFDLNAIQDGVPTTPCGIEAWAAANGNKPGVAFTTAEDNTASMSVGGLSPETDYQFALMVTCDLDCWAATLGVNSSASHAVQRSMYELTAMVKTGVPAAAPDSKKPGLAPGVQAVLIISVVLAVTAIVAGVIWYRRRAARQRSQYNVLEGEQYSIQSASTDGVGNYSRLVDDGQTDGGDDAFNSKLAQYLD